MSVGETRPPPLPADTRVMLYDYVPWEQMSKQRRGLMWALQTARGMDRALVLPPLRFQTARSAANLNPHARPSPNDDFDYRPWSYLFDLAPLHALHPVVELEDYLAANDRRVDLIFSINRGMPPKTAPKADHVEGPCAKWLAEAVCEVDGDGATGSCYTPLTFGGAEGVRAANVTCGWSPEMRWEKLMGARDARALTAVGVGPIVFQVPPPTIPQLVANKRRAAAAGDGGSAPSCGWQCAYLSMRSAMVYRSELRDEASRFLELARYVIADSPEPARIVGVHWRRGDFLRMHGGAKENVCVDERSGERLSKCVSKPVVVKPEALGAAIVEEAEPAAPTVVFLASNAAAEEVASLRRALGAIPLVQYAPLVPGDPAFTDGPQVRARCRRCRRAGSRAGRGRDRVRRARGPAALALL